MADRTFRLTGTRSDDFCLVHGYEHMRSRMGDPIPYCEACEREAQEEAAAILREVGIPPPR